jgi:aspartyl-tRNA(Asn)/glutamyl-tRNA(Gln) amidotransferase subunit C
MPLNAAEVRHLALLARLDLSPDEEATFSAQLDHILTHFEKLKQLDTDQVEPTAHIIDLETPYREDVVRNSPATEALLANAPGRDGRFFKVPKIIE